MMGRSVGGETDCTNKNVDNRNLMPMVCLDIVRGEKAALKACGVYPFFGILSRLGNFH